MNDNQLEPLVALSQHNIALLFANYLVSQHIQAQVVKREQEFVVYCASEHLPLAKQLFEEFIQNPHAHKYQQAAWDSSETTQVVAHAPSLMKDFKRQFLAHAGAVTLLVFIACWLVYVASVLGWAQGIFFQLRFFNELSLTALIDAPWRLIGPAFFHFSILHIAFNTMWWWQLGGAIERVMGKFELTQLFLLSAILSNLGQFMMSGPNFGGLSGVVYAVVGYVWWAGWLAPEKGLSLSKPIIGFLLIWLMLGYVDVLSVKMANTAHLVGLVVGCVLAWVRFAKPREFKRR